MKNDKKKILIINGRYLPGYKDGGPVRTIKNLTDSLSNEFEFYILTLDRDHGDEKPYDGIEYEKYNKVENANVFYIKPPSFPFKTIKKLAKKADLVYLCGCFSDYSIKTLILKRLSLIKPNVVVAAMGLFSPTEFRLKYKKKKLFTTVFNTLGMFKKVYWSATSKREVEEIKAQIKTPADHFYIATDLPRKEETPFTAKKKEVGALDIAWIGRIAEIKNLCGAIEILKNVASKINLTIYGPVHTESYWAKCQEELKKLPENITFKYKGNIESEEVIDTLKSHHILLFPTFSENYGHVIHEALIASCPAIISDQTPWNELEKNGAGFSIPLKDTKTFVKRIEEFSKMDEKEFNECARNAYSYAKAISNTAIKNTGYRTIFTDL